MGNLFYVGFVGGGVARLVLSPDGSSVVSHTQLDSGFVDPLDITMDADGTLYVAEYGSGNIVRLQPSAPTASPTPTPPPPTTATPTPVIQAVGDVNCDGVVNSIDAALLLQFDAGLIEELACQENADVSGDGSISSIDAALILQYDAGLIPSLPP